MRLLSYLTTFLVAALLAACGGGSGSPGLSTGSVSAFSVVAPNVLTLQVGLTQQYNIQGGVKPYSVFSSDPAVAVGWLVGENVVSVGTTAAGKAKITILDAKGGIFDIALTAGASTAFFTTTPSSLTIAPGPLAAQTFKLGGGTPPYKGVSSVPSLLSVVVNGTDVTLTALQVPGSAVVTLTDSSSPPATFSSTVTLGTIPLAVNPSSGTIATGSIFRGVITGGTPPYRALVTLDNCLIDAKITQGNIVQAKGNKACSGSVLSVIDANNQSVTMTIEIQAGSSALQLIPSVLTIPESTNTPTFSLLLYGANSGPIQVFSTDLSILAPQTVISNGDGTYSVPLTGGGTCSLVVAAALPAIPGVDNTVPKNNTFTDKKGVPDLTIQPADDVPPVPAVPATGGDRTITITVIDSTGRQGTSTITVKDTDGKAGCT